MNFGNARKELFDIYLKGNVSEALALFLKLIKEKDYEKEATSIKLNDCHAISSFNSFLGNVNDALVYAKKAYELEVNPKTTYGLCLAYNKLDDTDNALKYALEVVDISEKKDITHHVYDVLAISYFEKGDLESAKKAGNTALKLKDDLTKGKRGRVIAKKKIKAFNSKDKKRNVIAFSLFGDNPRYCENAVLNVEKADRIYPSWTCRFYCADDVPALVIERLKGLGAEVIVRAKTSDEKEMLFWRFDVMSDTKIDRYLVRDCDAVVNAKEVAAVKDWIKSGRRFHIMRDFYSHTTLVLAGMFGGTTDVFKNIKLDYKKFLKEERTVRSHLDQDFLAECVWPTMKKDMLSHDSCFSYEKSKQFPKFTKEEGEYNVGADVGNSQIAVDFKESGINKTTATWAIFDKNDLLVCRYEATIINSKFATLIPKPYEQKLNAGEYAFKIESLV